jgi:alkylated DNA repair protein alkB family protein 1
MCQLAATKIDYEFVPEASIVNFYPLNSSMGGHLDDAEHDLTKPIVSISLGRSSIFLMGGRQKTADPIPILARSGDIVIMSGESRYCYHGVPCIISRELEKELCSEVLPNFDECVESPDEDTRHVLRYLQDHRINLNVRQVKIENEIWVEKTGTGHVKYPLY